jgi:hypothetical protein
MSESTICRECRKPFEANYLEPTKSKMIALQVCFTCLFWLEKTDLAKDPRVVRIDGHHYIIGPEAPTLSPASRGMNGLRFRITFLDGRSVTTTNLWHQGIIPGRFRTALPDNASALEEVGRAAA